MLGTKLAHYEITSHLGTGGMGEVYQASDAKLGRNVAIKLLPEAFMHDADRAIRFEREARVLASLNHPRIAAIYGIEESGTRKFLVMELVAGQTLADRIARGPLPMDEALKVAGQIAEALEAAHEKGVIHRDLKPSNIKLTQDGQVKVLDFGLAKAITSDAADTGLSSSPTMISAGITNAGIILGTAAYMSPEQARGLSVDARSDIFAFGCVLYEMLAGRQLFVGETVSDILAGVLKSEPDWGLLPADTSQSVRRLLDRCLRKDPRRRLQAAADVRNEIEDAALESGEKPPIGVPAASARRTWIPWIVALGFLVVAAVLAVPYFRSPALFHPLRLDITTLPTDDPTSFAISPDGRFVVFVAASSGPERLWLRAMDTTTFQALPGTEGASFPFWSPNGKSIAYYANSKLMRVDIGGALPQTLATSAGLRGGTWSSEGVILYAPTNTSPLFKIPEIPGGTPVPVTKLDKGQNSHRYPSFIPNSRQFLFFAVGSGDVQGIYLGSLDSTDSKFLTAADTAGAYLEPGWLLFLRQGALVARRLDVSAGVLVGDPVVVADSVSAELTLGTGAFSASRTGVVAYRSGINARRQLTWFDRTGKMLGTLGEPDGSGPSSPVLAPDDKRAVIFRNVQGNTDVYIVDALRSTRFTFDSSLDRYPVWSHDGRRIAFDSNRKGHRNLYLGLSDRSGNEELLLESDQDKAPNDVSADGRFLLFIVLSQESGADIWVLPLDENGKPGKPAPFLKTMFEERQSQFSPDGHWVAYQSTESGSGYEIYVRPFPGPGGQYQISSGGGVQPRWRRDGKELYYVAPDGNLMAVSIEEAGKAISPGKPTSLFHTRLWGGGSNAVTNQQYAVSHDGRFLMNINADTTLTPPITILLNWKPPAE
jgi:eukaryotic-like serine/threonine-protein kinase